MCNFVIRPVKYYATVDIVGENVEVYEGECFQVTSINGNAVRVTAVEPKNGEDYSTEIPVSVFIHAFSDKVS